MSNPETGSLLSGLVPGLSQPQRPSRRQVLRYGLATGAALFAARAGLARAEPIEYAWVATRRATPLKLDPDGNEVRWLPRGILLRVGLGSKGPLLHAWCPAFATFGSVDAAAVEDAPVPTESEIAAQRVALVTPPTKFVAELPARVVGWGNVRFWPQDRPDTLVRQVGHNTAIRVVEVVEGEDGDAWYRLSEDVAGSKAVRGAAYFMHHSFVRVPRTDFHPISRTSPDRTPRSWFEADLVQPVLLTAYEDYRPVWSSLALHGKVPNVTPQGNFKIMWQVANETMTSERTYPPIPRNAPGGYHVTNVLYTQYFHWSGAAIHYNWWSGNWGYAASHGCLGLPLAEARWCWDWAEIGTPVKVFG